MARLLDTILLLLAAIPCLLGLKALPDFTLKMQKRALLCSILASVFLAVFEGALIVQNVNLPASLEIIGAVTAVGIGISLIGVAVFLLRSQKQEVNIINRQMNTDALTGLGNHAYFMRTAQRRFDKSKTYDLPTAIIVMDIDNFKSYNDNFGHEAGNQVLRTIGQVLSDSVRGDDILARYGGEEFVVMINEELDKANIVAERIRANVEKIYSPAKNPQIRRQITLSLGIAHLVSKIHSLEELIVIADNQMYRAKINGKNCVKSDEDLISSLFYKPSKMLATKRPLPKPAK